MDASVSIAIGDKDVTVRADGGFGWPVERRAQPRDAAGDLAVVAGVGGNTRRAQRHQQRAIGRELANGMIAVVDRVDEILVVDGQGVDALSEDVFTEGAD